MGRPRSREDHSILVVGGLNLDIQGRSSAVFRPGDSNPGRVERSPGGVGRNIAENLARLGCRVELLSVLGDDGASAELEASCAARGIGLRGTLRLPGRAASTYLCLLDADGGLVGAVSSMEAMEELLPPVLEERRELFDRADCVVVDANLPEASIAWIAREYGRGSGGRRPLLALDPVSETKALRALPRLGDFDLAKPNLREAAVLAGLPKEEDPDRLAEALLARGLGAVFISLGARGLYYAGGELRGPATGEGTAEGGRRGVSPASPGPCPRSSGP